MQISQEQFILQQINIYNNKSTNKLSEQQKDRRKDIFAYVRLYVNI